MKEVNVNNILKFIKIFRISENLSQAQMAEKLGISVSFYGMIERGNRVLSVQQLIKIANAFDYSIVDFLETIENPE